MRCVNYQISEFLRLIIVSRTYFPTLIKKGKNINYANVFPKNIQSPQYPNVFPNNIKNLKKIYTYFRMGTQYFSILK